MKTAGEIFSSYSVNGKAVTLGILANAAYHLDNSLITGEIKKQNVNIESSSAEMDYKKALASGLVLLTPTDLPSLSPMPVLDANFPTQGLAQGIYRNLNAAALVARSSNAIFISFRGTNDNPNLFQQLGGGITGITGTPDSNDWHTMENHFKLLQPLVDAIDQYLAKHTEIAQVYVTGHSLGAGMAQHYMSLAPHSGSRFEAITFANPGYGDPTLATPPHNAGIINVHIKGDPIENTQKFGLPITGDRYRIENSFTSGFVPSANLHDMALYNDTMQFLSSHKWSLPQPAADANNVSDQVSYFVNIGGAGTSDAPWSIDVPSGKVTGTDHADVLGARSLLDWAQLSGGPGKDMFVFEPGFGQVQISDFHPGEDVIQMDRSLFSSYSNVMARTAELTPLSSSIPDLYVTASNNNTIALHGVSKAQLHDSDFKFV